MQLGIFDEKSERFDDLAIIIDETTKISYKELWKEADDFARCIKERCLIVIVCKNCIESIIGYVGLIRARFVPLLVNSDIKKESLLDILKSFKPKYILMPTEEVGSVFQVKPESTYGNYSLLKTDYHIDYSINDQLALLLATSGSTGRPDMVRLSYGNIWSNTNAISESLNISSIDRAITTMPMSYSYGLSIINTHLFKGASIILTEATLMEKPFWNLIKDCEATTFGGVPFIYEMLKKLRFEKIQLPKLKYLTQAGGKLSQEMIEEFAKICSLKPIKFYVMYGQTEATARMSCLPDKYLPEKAGSIGFPIPGGRFWLEDSKGKVIEEEDTVGEIIYQGKNVFLGYANGSDDLSKGNENNGVLRTGDLAKFDREGFYYIVGRKSRFLKVFGHRVSLDKIEELVASAGYECVCGGADDKLRVFVTNKNVIEEVKTIISTQTTVNRSGFMVEHIDKIPRSESGKILYSSLNQSQ